MVVLNHIYTGILHTVVVLNHIYTGILHTVVVLQSIYAGILLYCGSVSTYVVKARENSVAQNSGGQVDFFSSDRKSVV